MFKWWADGIFLKSVHAKWIKEHSGREANRKYLDSVQSKGNGRVVRTECPVVHYQSAHTFILSAALGKFLSFSIDKITFTFNSWPLERLSHFTEPVGSFFFSLWLQSWQGRFVIVVNTFFKILRIVDTFFFLKWILWVTTRLPALVHQQHLAS